MDTWSLGRAALVGDSGWAMPPTLGQGAGFAMMNAYTMAVALDEATTIEEGLRIWEKRERPLTDETQQRSIEFAELGGRRVSLSVSDMNLRAQKHIPTGIQR
jgi:2-methyl-3-hydroxypyridine 5-carboxylic acid dioxygenase